MTWARFDDGYLEHPKVEAAGPLAEHLDMRAIIYCARNTTDGVVTTHALQRIGIGLPKLKQRVDALVAAGRWTEREGGGWFIHDFLEFNPSKAQVADRRSSDARRQALARDSTLREAVKKRDGGLCRYCGIVVVWTDKRSAAGGTYDHVDPKGGNDAENIVVACRGCNSKKASRTPAQARMPLRELSPFQNGLESDLGDAVGSGRESVALKIVAENQKPDPDCFMCWGRGFARNPRSGIEGPCECTKPLAATEERAS